MHAAVELLVDVEVVPRLNEVVEVPVARRLRLVKDVVARVVRLADGPVARSCRSRCRGADWRRSTPVPTTPSPHVCVHTLLVHAQPGATWQSTQPGARRVALLAGVDDAVAAHGVRHRRRAGRRPSRTRRRRSRAAQRGAPTLPSRAFLDTYRGAGRRASSVFPAHSAQTTRIAWNGRRTQRAQAGMPPPRSGCSAMLMFAGKTQR